MGIACHADMREDPVLIRPRMREVAPGAVGRRCRDVWAVLHSGSPDIKVAQGFPAAALSIHW